MKRQRIRLLPLSARSTGRRTYRWDDLFVFTGKPKPPPVRTAS
jgi:hypothetical protein